MMMLAFSCDLDELLLCLIFLNYSAGFWSFVLRFVEFFSWKYFVLFYCWFIFWEGFLIMNVFILYNMT